MSSIRLLAMFSPRPLPSVWREASPRTKRSMSSSALTFSRSREMFFMLTATRSSRAVRSMYTRLPARAYLHTLLSRLSSTRQRSRPSARAVRFPSKVLTTTSSFPAASRSS